MQNKSSKVSVLTFIGMTCALVVSIRNIPDVAASGYTMFLLMLIATLLYAIPISLIASEFSGMYPGDDGGMETWVTKGLGKRWGFVTSWLLWVQMFPGMVMISSALAPLIAIIIGQGGTGLGENKWFTFGVILFLYWSITVLNVFFDMTKFGGKVAIWIGLYVPFMILTILGIAATIKIGVKTNSVLGQFQPSKLFPGAHDLGVFQYLAPIMFIFTGIEMSAVHSKRLKNPSKGFIIGIFAALVIMFVLNTSNGFMIANAVPSGGTQLNNIAQSISLYTQALKIPHYEVIVGIFSFMVLTGVLIQLSAWAAGPSKTITSSARRGLYSPKLRFWKVNKHGISNSILITQACVITLFAGFYLLIPGVNNAFLALVTATAVLYSMAYVLMAISLARLRVTNKTIARPFKVGNFATAIFVVALLIFSIVASIVLTLIWTNVWSIVGVVVVSVVLFVIPIILYVFHKDKWKDQVAELIQKTPYQNAEN